MNFLFRYGEIFGKGSGVVSNVAYGMTMFQGVHQANWSVPKPAQMLLFGLIYWITGNLWFIHVLFAVAGALLVLLCLPHYGPALRHTSTFSGLCSFNHDDDAIHLWDDDGWWFRTSKHPVSVRSAGVSTGSQSSEKSSYGYYPS